MKEILDIIHKTIYQFFDVCGDDEEAPMSDKDKLLLEVNKAICNNLKALEQQPCEDAISRQAAIDALGEKPLAWVEGEYELGLQNQWENDVDAIKTLLPAQPKTGHWIDDDGDNAICGCCNRLNHLYGTYCKHCGAKMEVKE
jgi:hypothetical protein